MKLERWWWPDGTDKLEVQLIRLVHQLHVAHEGEEEVQVEPQASGLQLADNVIM
jgi:hypothetical protein